MLDTGGDEVEALDRAFERLERADRARERILLVSESRGAEVGPRFLGVVSLEVDPEGERALPFRCVCPFVNGSEGDEEAAETGDRSSGVEDKVLESPDTSPGL